MLIVRRVVRFVVVGGVVGGIVTVAWLLAWALFATWADFEPSWITGFLVYFVIGAFVGVVVGAPPALITGLAHTWLPTVRHPVPIALIGAFTSAIEGFFLPSLSFVPANSPSIQDRLEFAGVLALAGAVAAVVCHATQPQGEDS